LQTVLLGQFLTELLLLGEAALDEESVELILEETHVLREGLHSFLAEFFLVGPLLPPSQGY
jgi:hypothetical protein